MRGLKWIWGISLPIFLGMYLFSFIIVCLREDPPGWYYFLGLYSFVFGVASYLILTTYKNFWKRAIDYEKAQKRFDYFAKIHKELVMEQYHKDLDKIWEAYEKGIDPNLHENIN